MIKIITTMMTIITNKNNNINVSDVKNNNTNNKNNNLSNYNIKNNISNIKIGNKNIIRIR